MATTARRFSGLRPRLLMLALLPAIFTALLAAAGAFWAVESDHDDQMNQALTRASSLAERELDNSARRMVGYAATIAARPDLVTAMAANDAARLRDILVGALAGLLALDPTVAVLEITDTSGRIMMRVHAPTRFGDDKSKMPDVATALLGNPLLGSEVSPTSGQFATGAALSVRNAEGRIIGTIKVATRLTPAVVTELGKLAAGEAALFGAGQLVTSTVEGLKAESLPEVILNAQRQGQAISGLQVTLPGKGGLRHGTDPQSRG